MFGPRDRIRYSLSLLSRARYESKVFQVGSGVDHGSIDYLTPAVLYFARNWQMVQERTLHSLAGGRKELYISDRFKHPTTQQVLLDIDVLYYPYALPPM